MWVVIGTVIGLIMGVALVSMLTSGKLADLDMINVHLKEEINMFIEESKVLKEIIEDEKEYIQKLKKESECTI